MSQADEVEIDRKALEAFVVNNADLERLEVLLDQFNIFEAVGLVRHEIRHSTFLAFLLDPQGSHGLGDAFTKRLLQGGIMSEPNTTAPVTAIELSLWDLGQMEVRREWQHIDIFLLDERTQLAVIIENKIDTVEHSDQLQRYYETVKRQYPGYRIIGLYLTPVGDEPSHEAYLPLSYKLICEVLDAVAESRASVSSADLQIVIAHYTQMLRRHIVDDSEIAGLCQQIYQRHRRALDLINKHRPNAQAEIKKVLEELINDEPGLELDRTVKTMINFADPQWDTPPMKTGRGWTASGRVLLFEFQNGPDNLEHQSSSG